MCDFPEDKDISEGLIDNVGNNERFYEETLRGNEFEHDMKLEKKTRIIINLRSPLRTEAIQLKGYLIGTHSYVRVTVRETHWFRQSTVNDSRPLDRKLVKFKLLVTNQSLIGNLSREQQHDFWNKIHVTIDILWNIITIDVFAFYTH